MLAVAACLAAAPAQAQWSPELRGRVVDARSGGGLPDAEVRLDSGERVRTAVDGTFTLRATAPGRRTVAVRHVGHASQSFDVVLTNGTQTSLAVRMEPQAVSIEALTVAADAPSPGMLVLTRQQIAARGARDVADLLEGQAGLVITRRGGPGSSATLSVRGASANQLLVLVDGMPRNAPLTGEADLSTITTSDLERVTLLRGAASARYGPQALAGVLLIETRAGGDDILDVSADAGSYGDRAAQTRLSLRRGPITTALQAELRRNDNAFGFDLPDVRGGGSTTRLNADVRRLQTSATLGYEQGERRLRLRAELGDIARGMPGSVVQPSPFARQTDRRWSVQLSGTQPIGAWPLDAEVAIQQQRASWHDSLPPLQAAYDDRAALRTTQGRLGTTGRIGRAQLSIGTDARLLGVDATTLAADAPDQLRYAGAYVSLEQSLLSQGQWRGTAGLDLRGDIGSLVDGVVVSPRAHLRVARHRVGLAASWGRGFAPPTPADLFFQDGVQTAPNPALRPERVRNDVALSLDIAALPIGSFIASADVSAYSANIDGMILWSPNFRFVWSPFNADVRRRGGEASIRLGHLRSRTALQLQTALTEVSYVNGVADGQVIYRPRWTADLRLDTRAADIDATMTWRHTGARRTAPGSTVNLLPAFGVVDIRLQREVQLAGQSFRLRTGIANLLDARAAMLVDFPMPGRTWTAGISAAFPLSRPTP